MNNEKLPLDISIVQIFENKLKCSDSLFCNSECYENNCFEYFKEGFDVLLKVEVSLELHNQVTISLNDFNHISYPTGTFILMDNGVMTGYCQNGYGELYNKSEFIIKDVQLKSGTFYVTLRVKYIDCELTNGYFVISKLFIFRDSTLGKAAYRYLDKWGYPGLAFNVKNGEISHKPLYEFPEGLADMILKYAKDNNLDTGNNQETPFTHFSRSN